MGDSARVIGGRTLRPYGVVLDGVLERGLEVDVEGGKVVSLRACSCVAEPWVLSPAFVNAHSHLEYRGLSGKVAARDFSGWIVELTRLKGKQSLEAVAKDCARAARENRSTGVALVWEHSDRPGSLAALAESGIRGRVGKEVITLREHADPFEKIKKVAGVLNSERIDAAGLDAGLTPHSAYTVSAPALDLLAEANAFLSVHVAESVLERALFARGDGPLADLYRSVGAPLPEQARSAVAVLSNRGYLRHGVQFVHACDLDEDDFELIVGSGVTVAHCPRSNVALGCPPAPIRRLLRAGVPVGLGLDSAASSGTIDMFSEMRSALHVSMRQGEPLDAREVWRMATGLGAASVFHPHPWEIATGSTTPLIAISFEGRAEPASLGELIDRAEPSSVSWI